MRVLADRSAWAMFLFIPLLCQPRPAASVEYDVVFEATWSAETHPGAYLPAAHFCPLIGAVHNDSVTFWEVGGIATPGIESMAETGATSTLAAEYAAAGSNVIDTIVGSTITSPRSSPTTFTIEETHPLVTLVTMIAPSPDWFVGVDSLSLRDGNAWIGQTAVELFAYDAGTDSGIAFQSPNADMTPHIAIALLQGPVDGETELGTFTFTLRPEGDFNGDLIVSGADFLFWQQDPSIGRLADWQANYGRVGSPPDSVQSVPEPAALTLCLICISLACISQLRAAAAGSLSLAPRPA